MKTYYQVGKIVNTHGLQGEVRVLASTDFPTERFAVGAKLFIMLKAGAQTVTVKSARQHKNFWLLTFDEFNDINQVERFKGADLKADQLIEAPLAENEYYYHDIVGLTIIDAHTKENLGQVTEILSPGANDVWVVVRPGKKEYLLPFLKSVVLKIDLDQQQALVDLPDGLMTDEN